MSEMKDREHLVDLIRRRILAGDAEFEQYGYNNSHDNPDGLVDYLFALPGDVRMPDPVMQRLRWGGRMVFISEDPKEVEAAEQPYRNRPEFEIEQPSAYLEQRGRFLGLGKRGYHYFIVRKMHLIKLGEHTDRFTYHVELIRDPANPDRHVVMKSVPTVEMMERRLDLRHTDLPPEVISKRARDFTERIFPLFLTREVGILKVVRKHLPERYHSRVPQVVDLQKNADGFVTRFTMSWMRNSLGPEGRPLTQLEFAEQSIELLEALHQRVKVIHLDLRPDNMVLTRDGVGFIDFGSSVRIGEDLKQNKILSKMFDQVMSSSGIQRMLGHMLETGQITSKIIRSAYHRIDKAVDLFFLVLQMTQPDANPDFKGLVVHDAGSREGQLINALAKRVLKPKDPDNPEFKTTADVRGAVERIAAAMRQEAEQRELAGVC